VLAAVRAGYRHVDCAAIYGNEHEVGEAFEELFAEGVVARGDLFVTSKLWNAEHGSERARAACLKTLADLKLDYLDLYLIR
jgi:diketogulonate reductase-like aldo/keto reductase